jgi:hypothetical protein
MQFHRDRTIVASTSVALLCYKRSEMTLSEIAEKPIDIVVDMAGDRAQSIASSAESAGLFIRSIENLCRESILPCGLIPSPTVIAEPGLRCIRMAGSRAPDRAGGVPDEFAIPLFRVYCTVQYMRPPYTHAIANRQWILPAIPLCAERLELRERTSTVNRSTDLRWRSSLGH